MPTKGHKRLQRDYKKFIQYEFIENMHNSLPNTSGPSFMKAYYLLSRLLSPSSLLSLYYPFH